MVFTEKMIYYPKVFSRLCRKKIVGK